MYPITSVTLRVIERGSMKNKLEKFKFAYHTNGIKGVIKKIIAYLTNWRVRRENIIWFLKRIHIGHPHPITHVHGLKYYVHSYDPGISRELAIYHTHEPLATKLFKNELKDGMYEVDIGSNIGYYALLAGMLVGPKGRVIAIEPEPNNYALLKMNVHNNNIENIETVQCAIGNKDGASEFYLTEASNTNSLIAPRTGRIVSSIQVRTRKLDTLIKDYKVPHIDFIRMDIEGGEIIAIKGMQTILKRYKPKVLVELHCDVAGSDAIKNLLSLFIRFGYQVDCILDRDKDFVWEKEYTVFRPSGVNEVLEAISGYRVATALLK